MCVGGSGNEASPVINSHPDRIADELDLNVSLENKSSQNSFKLKLLLVATAELLNVNYCNL